MTAIFLRPVATDTTGNWRTDAAGTDLHTAIDEATRNDADFIRSGDNPSGDLCRVRLGIEGEGEIAIPLGGLYTIYGDAVDFTLASEGNSSVVSWSDIDQGIGAASVSPWYLSNSNRLMVARGIFSTVYAVEQSYIRFNDVPEVIDGIGEINLYVRELNGYDFNGVYGDQQITLLTKEFGTPGSASDWLPSSNFGAYATGSIVTLNRSNSSPQYYTWEGLFEHLQAGTNDFYIVDVNQGTPPTAGIDETDVPIDSANNSGTTTDPYLLIDSSVNPVTIRCAFGIGGYSANVATISNIVRLIQNSVVISELTVSFPSVAFSATLDANEGVSAAYTRTIVPIAVTASKVRFKLQGHGISSLTITEASLMQRNGKTAAGLDAPVALTFGGLAGVSIPAGQFVWTDWLDYDVVAGAEYLVSIEKTGFRSRRTSTVIADGTYYGAAGTVFQQSADSYTIRNAQTHVVSDVQVSGTIDFEHELTEAEADDVDWAAVNDNSLPLFLEFVATRV